MKLKKIISAILCVLLVFAYGAVFCVSAEEDLSGATELVFSDTGITVNEGEYDGYKIEGTALTLNKSGVYRVSGSCSDGSIKIKKGTEGVTLVLAGLDLTSSSTAPISCNKSTSVTIIAAEGSKNVLTDSEKNNDENYPANEDAENAVIKCKDGSDVTITGSGSLVLNANGKNGIKSGATTDEEGEARLEISDISLTINAPVNDGINAEQLLEIKSGTLTVSAGDDGIHCDRILYIGEDNTDGPTVTVENSYEGIEAAELYIRSGKITVHSTDDCLNAANSDLSNYAFKIVISGGEMIMDTTAGDGIDSNGTLDISGGTVIVWTANRADNQPLDADGSITVSGGTVLAAGGSSGMGMKLGSGAAYVIFGNSGGTGGFPGGNGGFPGGGRGNGMPGGNDGGGERPEMPSDMTSDIPNDGERPDLPSDMPSDMPDDGSRPEMPSDMPGNGGDRENSGSGTISISKGDAITIEDADGNTVYSGTALTDAAYLFFSSDDITNGSSYKLLVNGTEAATATSGSDNGSGNGSGNVPGRNDGSAENSGAVSADASGSESTGSGTNTVPAIVWVLLGASAVMLVGGIAALIISKKKKAA